MGRQRGEFVSGDSREQPLIGECDSVPRSFLHNTLDQISRCAHETRQSVNSPAQSGRILFESPQRNLLGLSVFPLSVLFTRQRETKRGREESGPERRC